MTDRRGAAATTSRRRPGGRSAGVREDVLRATLGLLREGGIEAVTIPGVAARAGVHHTSVYRRWGDRAGLLRDVLVEAVEDLGDGGDRPATPGPGPGPGLREGLLELLDGVAGLEGTAIGSVLLDVLRSDDLALTDVHQAYWKGRSDRCAAVVERAVRSGEAAPGTDPGLVLRLLVGPWFAPRGVGGSAEREEPGAVVDAVLEGIRWPGGGPAAPSPEPSDGPSTSTRRSRGRAQRRDAVYAAGLALFVERGFDGTTMEDIAERAEVARATVFNHFPRKAAFLEEWSARRRLRAAEAVRGDRLEDRPIREILDRYMTELARISIAERSETAALLGAALHATDLLADPELGQELTPVLRRARERGEIAGAVDPRQAAMLLAAGYLSTLTGWISAEPAPFELAGRLRQLVSLVLDGAAGRPVAES